MKRKVFLLTTVAIIALLTSSFVAVSQAWMFQRPKPEYAVFSLKLNINPSAGMQVTYMDTSNYPNVIQEASSSEATVVSANITIDGVTYVYPRDFDYNYTGHMEINYITGDGLNIVQETITFKHLPGHPTLTGRAEEKMTGFILAPDLDMSHYEEFGSYQLTGTKMLSNVQGDGFAICGVSTGLMVQHYGLIKGWPF
jgi:hypothetical protein